MEICPLYPGLQGGGGAGIITWHSLRVTDGLQELCKDGRYLATPWHEGHTPNPPPMGDSMNQSQPMPFQPTSGVPSWDEADLPSLVQESSKK